ncbi:DUF2793 domain-containing protein [Mesorhizobium soli]|uniref:DUF2793 domain-containing protein n=1 Tax=Pseudaminobacter soli (ex Li et al. 2025) TaxID=1295366 RepID=A0A2P7SCU7_9HYPH|nr:hypothetical protein C7I85_14395 [Mesorhizobium soli]
MDNTPNLALPYLMPSQAQKHVTHNEALQMLDALVQLSVQDRDLAAPPSSVSAGERWIVASGATGAWAGQHGKIAVAQDGGWIFLSPGTGWLAWVADEAQLVAWDGGKWTTSVASPFQDTLFTLVNEADASKQAKFLLSGITAGQTRTYTLPNLTGALATIGNLSQTFSGATTFSGTFTASGTTVSFGTGTGASTVNLGTGATTSGNTKIVNIGTGGANGSTTNVNIGPTAATAAATVTFSGRVLEVLAASANVTALYAGIGGATADSYNRLSINSPAVLFNHAGASMQATLNKSASGNDAGFIFQTNWSSRALFGTLGDDNFTMKVSPDGSAFFTSLELVRTSGLTRVHNGLELVSQASDPGTPVNGQLWYNHTSGRFQGRKAGRTVTLGDDELPGIEADSGRYVCADTGVGTTPATVAGAANRISLYPFIPKFDFTADRIGANVTTAVASAQGKIVVYESDARGRPSGRITETGTLDFSTAGAKEATVSLAFRKGVQYWLGLRHSSTATVSAWQPDASPNLDLAAIGTTVNKTLQRTLAFATATPAAWGYVASEAASTSAPAIWMRVA